MASNLDLDALRTLTAIAESGTYARAADQVHRTQAAVSMQMKRLEDTVQRPLFTRDGRQNRLTLDGERLLDYARRMVRLNDEAVATFTRPELTGVVRLGTPDDFARLGDQAQDAWILIATPVLTDAIGLGGLFAEYGAAAATEPLAFEAGAAGIHTMNFGMPPALIDEFLLQIRDRATAARSRAGVALPVV